MPIFAPPGKLGFMPREIWKPMQRIEAGEMVESTDAGRPLFIRSADHFLFDQKLISLMVRFDMIVSNSISFRLLFT